MHFLVWRHLLGVEQGHGVCLWCLCAAADPCVPVISWNHGSDGFGNLVPSTISGEQCLHFCLRVAYQSTGHRLGLLKPLRSVSCDLGGPA